MVRAPKLLPAMMTAEPMGPALGVRLVMLGGGTVKVAALLTRLAAVFIVTLPVVVPAGTGRVMAVSVQPFQLVETPEPVKVMDPQLVCPHAEPNPEPLIMRVLPGVAEDGERLEIDGLTV